jgi:hypothetical protein
VLGGFKALAALDFFRGYTKKAEGLEPACGSDLAMPVRKEWKMTL